MENIMVINGIECYEKYGVAYLKLETVARGLGFVDTSKGEEYVRWNTVRQYLKDLGISQEVAKDDFIPENIFYRLAMKAKNETAERFQALVADEIIPSIRKTGGYIVGQETLSEDALIEKALQVVARRLEEREKRVKELETENAVQRQAIADFQPVKRYVDTILESKDSVLIGQIAADYDLSAKALNKILQEEHLQRKINGQWILYAEHMGKGYTDSKTYIFQHRDGNPGTHMHTRWTQKGRLAIHAILERRGIKALMDR